MEEYVILVDQNDNPIGKEDKVKCHLPNGITSQGIYCADIQWRRKITVNQKE